MKEFYFVYLYTGFLKFDKSYKYNIFNASRYKNWKKLTFCK